MVRRFDLVGGKAVAEAAVLLCGATKEATPEGDCEAILINPWVQEMVAVEDVLARGRKDSRRHVMDMLAA